MKEKSSVSWVGMAQEKVQLSKAIDCFFNTQKDDKDFQKLINKPYSELKK
jgi:hypothetical protein